MISKTLALASLSLSILAHASEAPKRPQFSDQAVKVRVTCEHRGMKGEFLFTHAKDLADTWDGDGYQHLWFQSKKPIAVGPEWDARPVAAESGPCGKWLATPIGNNIVGIAIRVGDRPFPDQIGVLFANLKTGKIITASKGLGSIYDLDKSHPKPEIAATSYGFRFLTWMPRTDGSGENLKIRGRQVTTGEEDLYYWLKVTLKGRKIVTRIDRDTTWKDTSFKKFFKNQAEFERAFALSKNGTKFEKGNIVSTAVIGTVSCIQPTADRKPQGGDGNWFCDDLKR